LVFHENPLLVKLKQRLRLNRYSATTSVAD
jgi:hypothetical protein